MNLGKEFEEYIKYIFSHILNVKDEGIELKERIKLTGISGVPHEIDLFYEFDKSGFIHKVAIECKNTKRPTEKKDILDFVGKLNDFRNVMGIFISKNGFQSGAKEFGEKHGLILMEKSDLPTFPQMLADRLKTVAIPDESYIGEPFWVIMEIDKDNKNTGTYYGTRNPFVHVPIYFSKRHAESMLNVLNEKGKTKYAVRGLTQFALRAFIITMKFMNVRVMICMKDDKTTRPTDFFAFEISLEELERQYYYGEKINAT
ncbi:restriction endonuclease [Marinifilum sp. D714]|uniref:restriction endonuclease n=1 Tax=Marinifilum sp. D714 TaxID=2937523 RepID=UPI0027BEDD30|nr:restriction endonuclease [Marinifilum sp. D714]MDQ2178096.1 restriction endonuclease [Marinifilum sp. D714]